MGCGQTIYKINALSHNLWQYAQKDVFIIIYNKQPKKPGCYVRLAGSHIVIL